jgi:hypothetical protein
VNSMRDVLPRQREELLRRARELRRQSYLELDSQKRDQMRQLASEIEKDFRDLRHDICCP